MVLFAQRALRLRGGRLELNGPDIADPHPWLPELIPERALPRIASVDGGAVWQQGKMATAGTVRILKRPQSRVAYQVIGEKRNHAAAQGTQQVMTLRRNDAETIVRISEVINVVGQNGIQYFHASTVSLYTLRLIMSHGAAAEGHAAAKISEAAPDKGRVAGEGAIRDRHRTAAAEERTPLKECGIAHEAAPTDGHRPSVIDDTPARSSD
jgi:hypothetical protein